MKDSGEPPVERGFPDAGGEVGHAVVLVERAHKSKVSEMF
jgi:hypothetical protein